MSNGGTQGGTPRDVESQRFLRSDVGSIGETSKEKQEKIWHLQKESFQLANYYFLFQGVIFTAIYSTQSHVKCEYRWIPFALSLIAGSMNLCSLLAMACSYKTALDEIDITATAPQAGSGGNGVSGPPIAVKCASTWRLVYAIVSMICVISFFVITLVGCLRIPCGGHTATAASPTAG